MKLLKKEQLEPYENSNVTFVKKNLKINIWKTKNIVKLEMIFIIQGGYRGAVHGICNLNDSVPKKFL